MNKYIDILKLANGLKNSNEESVAKLAEAYISLFDLYYENMTELSMREILDKHEELLKRLEDL